MEDELVGELVKGSQTALARLITLVENEPAGMLRVLPLIQHYLGRAFCVGFTGPPGAGKSSLVSQVAKVLRPMGKKLGIIAVDPTSPFSGGAFLGDRIRMQDHFLDPGVFIRSMATRGSLGGLARATGDVIKLMDASGCDYVLVETVGVGQDEIDVVRSAHTTIVVSAPGLGDDVQAIKAGLLEIADIHVVSKCDREDAARTLAELGTMLGLAGPARSGVRLIGTSVEKREGIDKLLAAIDEHWKHLHESGEIALRRNRIHEARLLKAGEEILRERFARLRDGRVSELLAHMEARRTSPYAAAGELLETMIV